MDHKAVYSLPQLVLYFLRLGTIGFGGPVALVGYMHQDLVEERKWISEEEYKQGLALAQLAPGPLAAQLSIYLGFVHHRIWGAAFLISNNAFSQHSTDNDTDKRTDTDDDLLLQHQTRHAAFRIKAR